MDSQVKDSGAHSSKYMTAASPAGSAFLEADLPASTAQRRRDRESQCESGMA